MSRRSSIVTRSTRSTANAGESDSHSLRSRTLSGGVANRTSSTSSASREQRSTVHAAPSPMGEQTSSGTIHPRQQSTQPAMPMPSSFLNVNTNDDDMEITDEEEDSQTSAEQRTSKKNLPPVRHLFREDAPGVFTCLVQVNGKTCEKVQYCSPCLDRKDERLQGLTHRRQSISDVCCAFLSVFGTTDPVLRAQTVKPKPLPLSDFCFLFVGAQG
jgi:hypothetical protein